MTTHNLLAVPARDIAEADQVRQANGRAIRTRTTFRLEYAVTIQIATTPERVWRLLTDAPGFPVWNSTVTSIEGAIEMGGRLKIRVPLAPGRVFKPRVKAFEPARRMVWADGAPPMFRGARTFTLTERAGGTEFTMAEVFSGLMLPMIAGSLPDFTAAFEQYAADLKRAAERA
jgi:uncharacterized protein YndB with AHSA1/START domain